MMGARAEAPDWEAFFDAHGAFIFSAVRRFGGAAIDPEDATQEVMMVVLRQFHTFEGRSAVRTWLYRICMNVASEHRRRHRRRAAFESVLEAVTFWKTRDEEPRLEARNALGQVRRLMGRVPEKFRQVLVLTELEGLSVREAAEVLDVPEPTIRARLHYARKEMLALIEKEGRA